MKLFIACFLSCWFLEHSDHLSLWRFLYKWVHGISIDRTGKRFVELIPRSLILHAKINEDWRLKNALHVLTEVNSVNGGRRLTIMSPFKVLNKTNHTIELGKMLFKEHHIGSTCVL